MEALVVVAVVVLVAFLGALAEDVGVDSRDLESSNNTLGVR